METELPFGTRLHQLAQKTPDESAIIFAAIGGTETSITWAQLDNRSTQIARLLAGRGLRRGDLLAMELRNSCSPHSRHGRSVLSPYPYAGTCPIGSSPGCAK
jgi:acyl-CoA synthetase (AMP-forming)/AMP-acid ligase II